MNHCLFKAKDTKGAVGNTVDYSSLTIIISPLFIPKTIRLVVNFVFHFVILQMY